MKNTVCVTLISLCLIANGQLRGEERLSIRDGKTEAAVDAGGNLVTLKNLETGRNFAGGEPLWRLYYDKKDGQLENELTSGDCSVRVSKTDGAIVLRCDGFVDRGTPLDFQLELTIRLEDGLVRFASEVRNNQPHTIIRELQYPLIGDVRFPDDFTLLTTHHGGQLWPNVKKYVNSVGNRTSYAAPAQFFRDASLVYPGATASNCFALTGENEGVYFGSHDNTFQCTIHGVRVYPDDKGDFNKLEGGLYKYPNCVSGARWYCDANTVVPYCGSWHETSRIYRTWADTWWHQREIPDWIRLMKGWQRIIFIHQYGEHLFSIDDLNGKVKRTGQEIDLAALMAFGWWKSGMDNGYPDSYFETDERQGGDAAWKKAIADYQKDGGKFLIYFNGKLIDRTSPFYRTGEGARVCYRDNTGGEYLEQYRFPAHGTFTGLLNARSFVTADLREPAWKQMLLKMADRGLEMGADSVFYDQLGYAEASTNWDVSGEFAIPNLCLIADKAEAMRMLHDYLDTKGKPDVAIGTEHLTDVVAQHADYIHGMTDGTGGRDFVDWVRFTFPEIVLTDRTMRDDTDAFRRVNHSLLKGLRNNVEIYRCRDLIDKAPNFKKRLTEINAIRSKHPELLLLGTYRDTLGFENSNPAMLARAFEYQGDMAIVVTQSTAPSVTTRIDVKDKKFSGFELIGKGTVKEDPNGGRSVTLDRDALAVLIYRR